MAGHLSQAGGQLRSASRNSQRRPSLSLCDDQFPCAFQYVLALTRYEFYRRGDRTPSMGHGMGGCMYPITPRRTQMSRHPRVTEWTIIIQHHMTHLTKPQATVLALWSLGMVLARSCALTAVSAFLATWL